MRTFSLAPIYRKSSHDFLLRFSEFNAVTTETTKNQIRPRRIRLATKTGADAGRLAMSVVRINEQLASTSSEDSRPTWGRHSRELDCPVCSMPSKITFGIDSTEVAGVLLSHSCVKSCRAEMLLPGE